MSEIEMALVMNLLVLLFSATIVRCDQSMMPLRSFKIGENATYDCVDIYKQPGLDHPSLINHTIQMKPSSVERLVLKNRTSNNETYKKKIRCPDGTVPILRNSKEYNTKTQLFAEKYFHPLTADSHGSHIAGVRARDGPFHGIDAYFNAYALNIDKDQASYTQIYIGSGLKKQLNFIQAGFMINPSVFPDDGRVWSYAYWKGKNGKGCYNTACPGFVQVSSEVPIVEPYDFQPGTFHWLRYSIHQDLKTGNWWIALLSKPDVDIGYWPKELFNLLGNGASMVGAGGVVQTSGSGKSPPMGNGNFPKRGLLESALFTNIGALDSNYKERRIDYFSLETTLDSPKCYGLNSGKDTRSFYSHLGFFFNYGGPGGNSCGI